MNKKIRWITETALLLAMLIVLQSVTKSFGQIVTGSCVNAVLAIASLAAVLLNIAPQAVTVPAIMVGNTVFVVLLRLIAGTDSKVLGRQIAAWLVAALAKFAVLYILVVKIICGIASASLLASGALKEPMLKMLPTMFAWPQLITALIGGAVALTIVPVLRKALKR